MVKYTERSCALARAEGYGEILTQAFIVTAAGEL